VKALVVLNPAAGQESVEVVRESLERHFSGVHEYEIWETKHGDKAGDVVRARLAEGFDVVVAAGGDGTVSDVCAGLVGQAVPMGIVPLGTGNLLARELDLPLDTDQAVALIAGSPRRRKIDVIRKGGQTCVVNASVGFSASMVKGTSRQDKRRLGAFAYYWTALRMAFSVRRRRLKVEVDGKALEYNCVEVMIANCGKFFKQLYPMGPEMRLDDGHLDVWILSTESWLDFPRYTYGLVTGRPANLSTVYIEAKKSVTVRCQQTLLVQGDGDMMGTTPLDVELLPGALTVLVPEKPAPEPDFETLVRLYAARFPAYFRGLRRFKKPRA
jgi:diacylglycerol kinase (ATP)